MASMIQEIVVSTLVSERDFKLMHQTVKKTVTKSGIGLHSGETTTVRICPNHEGTGRYFVRLDLPETPSIPAQIQSVQQTVLSTELGMGKATVRTVEHLLASLVAKGIDHARIEVDGPELPLLDGSAQEWVEGIEAVGTTTVSGSSEVTIKVDKPVWEYQGDSFVAALPSGETRLSYGIDFPSTAIGNQWYSWNPSQENFSEAIAPARTFALASQITQLQEAGLIKGGSLDNALVCDRQQWLNPPLRFTNEPVRHKILDLVGDLSLLGRIPQAHFLAYKASHQLHVQLAKALQNLGSR